MSKKKSASKAKKRVDSKSAKRKNAKAYQEGAGRKSVIITFKPKDKRPNGDKDKLEIVNQCLESRVRFMDTAAESVGMSAFGTDEAVGFDVNLYEAPIVIASLTEAEIEALNNDENVESVEDDGECYAMCDCASESIAPSRRQGRALLEQFEIEAQPSVLAETIPAGVAQVKAKGAWGCSQGKGIKVAVLDTGIDYTHPDLASRYKGGVSFVPSQTVMDGNGHGTHCAGTIAAAINGAGVVGVAPAAALYGVKVLSNAGSGSWSWLIAGISWCIKNRIKVVSMSLGGLSAPTALESIINAAWGKGLLLVAAAGNYPSTASAKPVMYPAKYKSVIAVSAIDGTNAIAGFSARGPEIELCAPGVNVLSTVPGGGYGKNNGTSMACPHVSGAAALAWGGHRYASNDVIRRVLAFTADNLGVPGRDSEYGFGRVDAAQAACIHKLPPSIPGL